MKHDEIDFSKNKYDEKRIYYVYEWYNVDTGAIFYVGKGCKDRYKKVNVSSRNRYFLRYINKYNCSSRIIINNLNEEEAYRKEHEIILKYKELGYKLTNCDDGGHSGGRCPGEKNGMYGKTHTPEAREKMRQANLYHNRSKNFNSKCCDVYSINDEFIKHFDCITDAIDYLGSLEHKTYKTMVTYIWRYQNGTIDNVLGKYHFKFYRKSEKDNDVPSVSEEETKV